MPNQGLKIRIAAPLTLMLKTSSSESTKPRKGVGGVGDGGKNRAKPVGKHELDGNDDGGHIDGGGGRNSDFDVTFQVTRWRSRHCSSAKTIAFDGASEADHQERIPVALN